MRGREEFTFFLTFSLGHFKVTCYWTGEPVLVLPADQAKETLVNWKTLCLCVLGCQHTVNSHVDVCLNVSILASKSITITNI